MSFLRSLGIFGCAAVLALAPLLRAADETGADALKAKELVKAGNAYVLPVEQELADGMKTLRKLKVKVDQGNKQRRELETKLKMVKNAISGGEHQHLVLHEQFEKLTDVTQKNAVADKANLLLEQIKQANGIREDIEKNLYALGEEDRTNFVNQVLDLGLKVEESQAKYKELAADADIKAALDAVNQSSKVKSKLGPSPEYIANAATLKKWRGDVSSDTIPIKHENQVPNVEVTLNGTFTSEMVVDSGASMVCLTSDMAKRLNMIPGDKDPTIQFKMADGKTVEAKQMVLKSVRVGQFTVTDVDCAVLPESLVAAEPLLGGTFLNNFIFKMDPKAGELHLAVIAGNTKVTTAGGTKETKKTPTTPKAATVEKTSN